MSDAGRARTRGLPLTTALVRRRFWAFRPADRLGLFRNRRLGVAGRMGRWVGRIDDFWGTVGHFGAAHRRRSMRDWVRFACGVVAMFDSSPRSSPLEGEREKSCLPITG